jgi:hypothetical protein
LIIKENIFPDGNTASHLGGAGLPRARIAEKTVKNRTFTLYLRACAPCGCTYFLQSVFVSEHFSLSFGLDEASVRSAKICRINFFFPKCLIFPAKSSLTFYSMSNLK